MPRGAGALTRATFVLGMAVLALASVSAGAVESLIALRTAYAREVDRRLSIPDAEADRYAALLANAFAARGLEAIPPQHALLVDRNPKVQAALVFWKTPPGTWRLVGASPCSTGREGAYEHFLTPLGVFDHSYRHGDFRAEGTRNDKGVLGYGEKGMRVFDFGWIDAPRGWGDRRPGVLRLQVHATDHELLEPRLGQACSKGCVRIPATLNVFLDRHGILDEDYERALAAGTPVWQLRADRTPTPWPGRYLVVIETGRTARPAWARPRPVSARLRPR